jgi:3-methyladenine DNA glycosylase AlkD
MISFLQKELQEYSSQELAIAKRAFFQTAPGQYGAHDVFMGVTVSTLRKIASRYKSIGLQELQTLLLSKMNEERLLALIILTKQYQKAQDKEKLYQFYLSNLKHVNNWNLVDTSAHLIIGAHLWDRQRDLLIELATSDSLWERRIAIVATWYFIRKNDLEWTFTIANILLTDTHDLIHKAVGWMLREAGKKDENALKAFLEKKIANIPRTMLRYAIEKFPKDQRTVYLHAARSSCSKS